jgi:hypothetical protein
MIADIDGNDTEVYQASGCPAGGSVTFLKVAGGGHRFQPLPGFAYGILDFLLSHPKP